MIEEIELVAPENFSMVENGVYRSAFPRSKNCNFIKMLNLRSVVPLVPEDYPEIMAQFYASNGIKLLSNGLEGNKWPFKSIDDTDFRKVLSTILDPVNRWKFSHSPDTYFNLILSIK